MKKKSIGVRFRNTRGTAKKYLSKCVNWLNSVSKKTKRNINLRLHNAKVIIGIRISQVLYWVKNTLKKMLLPLITLSGVAAIVLTCYFLLSDVETRSIGEDVLEQFQYKIDFIGNLITSISLCAASLAIIVSIQKPKFKIKFINDHGFVLKSKKRKNLVTIGIDKNGNLGYQACVSNDWNMFLYNYGNNVAENIRLKMWMSNVYFDYALAERGYDLDDFMYGCGVFEKISYDLTNVLRQGEKIQMQRIPFHYSCADSEILRERGYTILYIQIYCNNQKATLLKYRVEVEEYDLEDYKYSEKTEEVDINNLLRDFIREHWQNDSELIVNEYNYYYTINPYSLEKNGDIQSCKKLYEYYWSKDLDKMVFWGRMYYRALGEKKKNIEAILQTEILKLSVKSK